MWARVKREDGDVGGRSIGKKAQKQNSPVNADDNGNDRRETRGGGGNGGKGEVVKEVAKVL